MTARQALKWLVAAGALCVGGLFADLELNNGAPLAPPSGPSVSPARDPGSPTTGLLPESTTPPAGLSGSDRPLVLAFWNVEWFPGRRPHASENARQDHIEAVVPVIERLNPDVLGLEEVADAAAAQLLADHVKGMRVDVCTQFVRDTGEPTFQQTVLCSRLPLLQAWWESWKASADGITPRRGFVFGAYQPAPGKVLLVYGLHLKSNREDEPGGAPTNIAMREESARQLLAHEQAMVRAYRSLGTVMLTVIGGDLNTSLDDPRFKKETTLRSWQAAGFRWTWQGVPLGERLTLPSEGRYPATCFDHVFLSGDAGKLLGVGLVPTGKEASDHRPVTVRLAF